MKDLRQALRSIASDLHALADSLPGQHDTSPPPQPLIGISEASELLGLSRSTLQELVHRGEIPAILISTGPRGRKRFRFDPLSLRHWWQTRESEGTS